MIRRASVAAIAMLLLIHCTPSNQLDLEPVSSDENQAIAERANELFHSPDDLVFGNPAAKITVVEFFDYNCGYCKRALPEIENLIKTDKDVRVVIKEFPVLGQGSLFAAKAALASGLQGKYVAFHHALNATRAAKNEVSVMQVAKRVGLDVHKLRQDMESPKVEKALQSNEAVAKALSISGTPTFVFEDTVFAGFASFDTLSEHVAALRRKGG
jgi:protein-disulfide isomerase